MRIPSSPSSPSSSPLSFPPGSRPTEILQARAEQGPAWDLSYLHAQGSGQERLRHAAQEMESVFVKMMLKAMKDTVPKNELLNGGQGEEIFDDMLTEERARAWSRSGTLGLADQIVRQMSRPGLAG